MKLTIITWLLILISFLTFAQSPKIDSLECLLKNVPDNRNKALIFNDLANHYLGFNAIKAQILLQQGLALSQKIRFPLGEMKLLYTYGEYNHRQGNYVKGIEYLTQSLKTAELISDSLGITNAYYMLGIIYTDGLKQYDLALQNVLKALPYLERNKKLPEWGNTLNLLAWIYAMTKQKMDFAYRYNTTAIKLAHKLNDEKLLAYYLGTKALIFNQTNELDSALVYFQWANRLLEKNPDKAVIAYNNIFVGKIYYQRGQYNRAIQIFEQAKLNAQAVNAREFLKYAYEGLSDAYAQQKDYAKAYQWQSLYTQLKDSLINWEASQKIALVHSKYEEAKQQVKINQLQKEKILAQDETRQYILFFLAVFLLISIILGLIIRNNRQSRFANYLLKEKNDAIAQQSEELQQIHNEVVNQRDLLDIKVRERTNTLKIANKKLRDYAFANSHKVRRPVGTILGLISLYNQKNLNDAFNLEIINMLFTTAQELEAVTREINQNLEDFEEDSKE